ncbi:MAG: VirB8/TrbF family protein [Gemmatimonadota bacterium]|nr:VirB8/TrbF family protein [Deltaproteobacteria bacterium]MDE2973689.1 VirB8/TrbF family protein [Gemmatimonadota bacterium]
MKKSDAGKEFAQIWGEAIHANRHLRVLTAALGLLCLLLIVTVFRLSGQEPPRPIVVRVDEVGRAEAVAYEAAEAQADPLDPTTKYFLNRFLHDYYSRQTATVEEYWARSLRFLTPDLANAAFRTEAQTVALVAAGGAREQLRVDRLVLRIQAQPNPPHGATADFDLVRTDRFHKEIARERWTVTLQFVFMAAIPPELVPYNPMGLVITYLQGDRAMEVGAR